MMSRDDPAIGLVLKRKSAERHVDGDGRTMGQSGFAIRSFVSTLLPRNLMGSLKDVRIVGTVKE